MPILANALFSIGSFALLRKNCNENENELFFLSKRFDELLMVLTVFILNFSKRAFKGRFQYVENDLVIIPQFVAFSKLDMLPQPK